MGHLWLFDARSMTDFAPWRHHMDLGRLPHLQRQFAYDRLLARLYLLDDGWILKGATALLARHIAVRHTVDVQTPPPVYACRLSPDSAPANGPDSTSTSSEKVSE